MGVQFDRILDGFDGPFTKVNGLLPPPAGSISGPARPAGYLISHQINNSFILINRLLKAERRRLLAQEGTDGRRPGSRHGRHLGSRVRRGAPGARPRRQGTRHAGARRRQSAQRRGPQAEAHPHRPLRPVRRHACPRAGPRWLFEQYEIPVRGGLSQTLDAGDLKSKFDVLVFADGAIRRGRFGGRGGGGGGRGGFARPRPRTLPRSIAPGSAASPTTRPCRSSSKFVESGGSVVTIGSSTSMAELLRHPGEELPHGNGPGRPGPRSAAREVLHPGLAPEDDRRQHQSAGLRHAEGRGRVLRQQPGLQAGAAPRSCSTPRRSPGSPAPQALDSGWAWGQQYLDGGTAVAEATVGEGKVVLLGPEVTFRGQPHGTFKLLFNGLYYGSAKTAALP